MFTAGATFLDRAREFHRQRLEAIHGQDCPQPLSGHGGHLVLHIIPFSAFGSEIGLDPRTMHGQYLPPIWSKGGYNTSYNVDGYLTTAQSGTCVSYTQIFRNGIVESAAGDVREQGARLFTRQEIGRAHV